MARGKQPHKRSRKGRKPLAPRKRKAPKPPKGSRIHIDKKWRNKGGDDFARYRLRENTPREIERVIKHVSKRNKKRRFIVNGQADFRNKKRRIFTNNTHFLDPKSRKTPEDISDALEDLSISPSSPDESDLAEDIDIEGLFVEVRYERKLKRRKPRKKPKRRSKRK